MHDSDSTTEPTVQFTPGPWTAHIEDAIWIEPSVSSDSVICDLQPRDADVFTEEDEANARLIAAAPDLLKACRFALLAGESGNWIGGDGIEELRDAIAKATGGAQ